MLRRNLFPILAVAVFGAATGCTDNPRTVVANPADGDNNQLVRDIGGPLFKPAPYPQAPARPGFAADPIIVSSRVSVADKVDIPTSRDGKIHFIGTELKPGEVVKDPAKLFQHRDKTYRLLEAGDRVEKDDLVMILDDREANAELELRRAAAVSANEIYLKSQEVLKSQLDLYNAKEKVNKSPAGQSVAYIELVSAYIDLKRAEATVADSKANKQKADEELKKAQVNYDFYYIRSSKPGRLQPFNRSVGESVKSLDMVLQIQNSDRLRAEGQVSSGFARNLNRDMPVTIEPAVEVAPRFQRRFHTQAINGVAFSNQATPLIVSVSDDKTARVWDGRSENVMAVFTHPGAVRSVACSPKGAAKQYCLTGAEDGKARLWDLSSPKSTRTPVRELEGFAHKTVITAVAFSPDGRSCVTADSRDIVLWDVESGKMRYIFPQVHLGDINSVTITPQCKLVSASRDLTVRIWSLGENGAKLDYTQEGRTGDVSHLGVSSDGRQFLADIGQSLQLVSLPDRAIEGQLESPNETFKFASFAVFSHDSKMILAGAQGDVRLSVWRVPTAGSRATEIRQFVPEGSLVTFTCAAVSDSDVNPIAATGTKDGKLFVWPMPTEKDAVRIKGTLKFIDQNVAATKKVRIYAEFDNTAKLFPGDAVTIVIEPPEK